MKSRLCILAFACGMAISQVGMAQAPAGSTGQCKDGTYTSNATKKGSCRGHQGVKEWYAATPAAAPAAAAAAPAPVAPAQQPTAPTTAPTPRATTSRAPKPANLGSPAPGGGPGLVWLNSSSNVYHCPGTKYYGTTKAGKYETEAAAKAAGAHGDHGKGCGQ